MKSKVLVLVLSLIIVLAAAACFAAGGVKLKTGYKANYRYTYKANDNFKLKSATAYGRNLLDQEYELTAESAIYERPLSVDKYGNFKLKTLAEFKKIELNNKKQPIRQANEYQVALFSPRNVYKNIIETSIAGISKKYEGTKAANYPVFVNYSDMVSATFVLPESEISIGEKWYPETIELDKNGYIKSEFVIDQIKDVDGDKVAYISGTAQALLDVETGVRFFRKVIPADLLSKKYSGQAQIQISEFNVVFDITKGIVKECEVYSDVYLSITDPTSGLSMNAVLEAELEKELEKTAAVK